MPQRVFLMIIGIWLGVILGVGYLVAPTLFVSMSDKQMAGAVAGEIFKHAAMFTIFIVVGLLIFSHVLFKKSALVKYRTIRRLLILIIFCALLASLVIQPWMGELKNAAVQSGVSVMSSEHAKIFGRLHGVSSILFLFEALLGLLVFWKSTKLDD